MTPHWPASAKIDMNLCGLGRVEGDEWVTRRVTRGLAMIRAMIRPREANIRREAANERTEADVRF